MRWIVGDVQGCALELDDLLRAVRFDAARDELWVAGDLVNRGPDSAAAVRLWRDAGGRAVIGNHDVNALLVAAGERAPKPADTLDGLLEADDRDELLAALRELPLIVRLPGPGSRPDVWLVHAGLHPGWRDPGAVAAANDPSAVEHDDDWLRSPEVCFATRVRCCTSRGELSRSSGPPSDCRPPFRPWDELYEGPLTVLHGHWAMRGHYRGPRTIGLDSGCCYGGSLTAWCHEEDRVVQVPSRLCGGGPVHVL